MLSIGHTGKNINREKEKEVIHFLKKEKINVKEVTLR